MKKLFAILTMLMALLSVQAQNSTEISLKLDSVQLKLNQLQRENDFLNCEYKLSTLSSELKIFGIELQLKTNEIIRALDTNSLTNKNYQSYKMGYEQYVKLFESIKNNIGATNFYISKKIETSNLFEYQIDYLKNTAANIKPSLSYVQTCIDYYKAMLECYENTTNK